MGDLTLLEQYKEAAKDVIDPALFGIGTKTEVIGTKQFFVFKASMYNGYMLLSKHPKWIGRIQYCQFENKIHIDGVSITPEILLDIIIWIGGTYRVNYKKDLISDIVLKISKENQYHSLLEKFKNGHFDGVTEWDGVPRIDEFLYKYLGVSLQIHTADDFENKSITQQIQMDKDNEGKEKLIKAYSRKLFLSLMARLLWSRIGTDIDVHTILCIYGPQGIGKGFTLKNLCLEDKYFSNTAIDMRSKDAPLQLRGKMIYELAELAKRSKDIEIEKAFITDAKDVTVLKYEKYSSELPRQCIFVATTNKLNILRDATGSRRWWPIIAGETFSEDEKIDVDTIKKIAPQLWHESIHILTQQTIEYEGQSYTAKDAINKKIPGYECFIWWLTPDEEKQRIKDRDIFMSVHPWTDIISQWIDDQNKAKIPVLQNEYIQYKKNDRYFVIRNFNSIYECLDIDSSKRNHNDKTTIEMLLTEMGFFKKRWRFDGNQITGFAKKIHEP